MRVDENGNHTDSCALCKFWEAEESGVQGVCARFPPAHGGWVPSREMEMSWIGAIWPRTIESAWCGEFSTRRNRRSD